MGTRMRARMARVMRGGGGASPTLRLLPSASDRIGDAGLPDAQEPGGLRLRGLPRFDDLPQLRHQIRAHLPDRGFPRRTAQVITLTGRAFSRSEEGRTDPESAAVRREFDALQPPAARVLRTPQASASLVYRARSAAARRGRRPKA